MLIDCPLPTEGVLSEERNRPWPSIFRSQAPHGLFQARIHIVLSESGEVAKVVHEVWVMDEASGSYRVRPDAGVMAERGFTLALKAGQILDTSSSKYGTQAAKQFLPVQQAPPFTGKNFRGARIKVWSAIRTSSIDVGEDGMPARARCDFGMRMEMAYTGKVRRQMEAVGRAAVEDNWHDLWRVAADIANGMSHVSLPEDLQCFGYPTVAEGEVRIVEKGTALPAPRALAPLVQRSYDPRWRPGRKSAKSLHDKLESLRSAAARRALSVYTGDVVKVLGPADEGVGPGGSMAILTYRRDDGILSVGFMNRALVNVAFEPRADSEWFDVMQAWREAAADRERIREEHEEAKRKEERARRRVEDSQRKLEEANLRVRAAVPGEYRSGHVPGHDQAEETYYSLTLRPNGTAQAEVVVSGRTRWKSAGNWTMLAPKAEGEHRFRVHLKANGVKDLEVEGTYIAEAVWSKARDVPLWAAHREPRPAGVYEVRAAVFGSTEGVKALARVGASDASATQPAAPQNPSDSSTLSERRKQVAGKYVPTDATAKALRAKYRGRVSYRLTLKKDGDFSLYYDLPRARAVRMSGTWEWDGTTLTLRARKGNGKTLRSPKVDRFSFDGTTINMDGIILEKD